MIQDQHRYIADLELRADPGRQQRAQEWRDQMETEILINPGQALDLLLAGQGHAGQRNQVPRVGLALYDRRLGRCGSVPVGQSAIFVKVTGAQLAKGGGVVPGSLANDWRAAVIP
jgi:hypothetical protein